LLTTIDLPTRKHSLAQCELCPLIDAKYVPSRGLDNADILVIGEAPGLDEVIQQKPFCLAPHHLVFMADFSWKPLGDVSVGDRVIGIDEYGDVDEYSTSASGCNTRRWRVATVTQIRHSRQDAWRVPTTMGDLIGTGDHRVMTLHSKIKGNRRVWTYVDALVSGKERRSRIAHLGGIWKQSRSYEAGWLSGFFDGEGHVVCNTNLRVGYSQNAGMTDDMCVDYLASEGFLTHVHSEQRYETSGSTCMRRGIRGSVLDQMRFLATIQPKRLIANATTDLDFNGAGAKYMNEAIVEGRERIGERDVVDISTTTGTFIADGFVVHNCGASGQVLDGALGQIYDLDRVGYTNAVACNPRAEGKNVKPDWKAVQCCRPRLLGDIRAARPKLIIPVGATGLASLLDDKSVKISQARGRVVEYDDVPVVPTWHPAYLLYSPSAWHDFARDLEKAVRTLKDGAAGTTTEHVRPATRIAESAEEALMVLAGALSMEEIVAVDIETATLLKRMRFTQDRIVAVSFAWGKGESGFTVPGEFFTVDGRLLALLRRACDVHHTRWLFHNGKFDSKFIRSQWGIEMMVDEDTMLLSYMLDERQGVHDLKSLAALHLGATDWDTPVKEYVRGLKKELAAVNRRRRKDGLEKVADTITYADVPRDILLPYAAYDAAYTMQLYNLLRPKVSAEGLDQVYEGLMIRGANRLNEMEMRGVKIDEEKRVELSGRLGELLVTLREEIEAITWKGFNPNSPPQLAKVLFEDFGITPPRGTKRTKDGRWSTAKDVLLGIKGRNPLVDFILSWRLDTKFLGTYVDGMPKQIYDDGRLHQDHKMHGTVTGRMSGPIVITFPKPHPDKPNLRDLVIAPDESEVGEPYSLVELDYSAGELRIAAVLSGEPLWFDAFMDGRDLHDETMRAMFGWSLEACIAERGGNVKEGEDLYGSRRRDVKTINFGVLYGMEEAAVARRLGWQKWEAKAFLRNYWEKHATLKKWIDARGELAVTTTVLTSPFGRKRRYGLVTRDIARSIRKEAGNYDPQSTLTDCMLTAICDFMDRYDSSSVVCPVIFMHDSMVIETPTRLVNSVAADAVALMMDVPRRVLHTELPFTVDVKVGSRWGSLDKLKMH
jgi:uracil-DNA glycosylase family 4